MFQAVCWDGNFYLIESFLKRKGTCFFYFWFGSKIRRNYSLCNGIAGNHLLHLQWTYVWTPSQFDSIMFLFVCLFSFLLVKVEALWKGTLRKRTVIEWDGGWQTLATAHGARGEFYILNSWKKIKRITFHDTGRVHKIQISVSIIKDAWNEAMPICLHTVCGCLWITTAKLRSCNRLYDPQHQKYLLSGSWQKRFSGHCTRRYLGKQKYEDRLGEQGGVAFVHFVRRRFRKEGNQLLSLANKDRIR